MSFTDPVSRSIKKTDTSILSFSSRSDKYDGYCQRMKKNDKSDLCQQDQGKSVTKLCFARLVVESQHAENGADTASDQSDQQEYGFGNPESMLHSADLVRSHGCDAHEIDKEQIYDQNDLCEHIKKPPKVLSSVAGRSVPLL